MRRVAAVLALALLLAVPAAARAQDNPFAPDTPAPLPEPRQPAPQPVAPAAQEDGLDDWQQLLILGVAVLLLGGIAVGILRDARRAAPSRSASAAATAGEAESRPRARARARARRKAKAARAARKRNR